MPFLIMLERAVTRKYRLEEWGRAWRRFDMAAIDTERPIEPLRDLLDTLLRPHDDAQQCERAPQMDRFTMYR